MRISGAYGTHLAPLIKVMGITTGDVLEIGMGIFSTPYLHYQCLLSGRKLVSMDNDRGWVKRFYSDFGGYKYRSPLHELKYVKNWEDAEIEKPWDVVLVDHSPDLRRIVEIKRLAHLAKFIVVHDTNERHEKNYHYSEIYPLFKYRKVWDKDDRYADILSNYQDLEQLW